MPDHPLRKTAFGLCLLTALNVLIHASATAAAAVPGAQAIAWHGQTAQVARGHIILKLRPDIPPAALASLAARHGFTEVAREDRIGAHLLAVPEAALERVLAALALDPAVEYAEPDFLRTRQVYAVPNDPLYQQAVTPGFGQFALVNTQTDRAWNDPDLTGSKGSLSEVLAVLDTGVYYPHADFAIGGGDTRIFTSPTGPGPVLGPGNIVGWDFANNDNDPLDDHGHGTHVAGIMGATADNGLGVAGMTWFPKLMPVKVLAGGGYGYDWWIIGGIFFARDNGAHVINMSLGSPFPSSAEAAALRAVNATGVVIVAASGNSGGAVGYPAAYAECIAVGSVQNNDQRASYSCYGPPLDLTAPGEGSYPIRILSTWNNGSYLDIGGTSMASPHVAGLVGLVLGQNPDWAPETVYRRLIQTADKVPPTAGTYNAAGWNQYMGYGRINTYQALGGITSTSTYRATLYLYDAMTTLSASMGTNPVARHVFPAGTPGTVAFAVTADDRNAVNVTSAVVQIRDMFGTVTTVPLTATPVTSRLTQYDAVINAAPALTGTIFTPDAVLTDAAGYITRIPLPAYTVATAVPVSLAAVATPNPADAATTSLIAVTALDALGNPVANVPIRAVLAKTPGGGSSLNTTWARTAGAPPAFSSTLTLSSVEGNHLLVFSISVAGMTGIATTLTVTGMTAMFVHKRVNPLPACAGDALTYTISWSRGGSATAFDLIITDTLPNGTAYRAPTLEFWAQPDGLGVPSLSASQWAATTAGPWTPGEPPDGRMPPLVLRWHVDRVTPGASGYLRFTASLSATLPVGSTVRNRAGLTITPGGRLFLTETATATAGGSGILRAVASAPLHATIGQWFAVTYTVTNTGAGGTTVNPALTVGPGGPLVTAIAGPVPAGPVVVAPGGAQTFNWTFSANGAGLAVFSLTTAGAACSAIVATGIQTPAALTSQGYAWPSPRNIGQTFKVMFTVTNQGGATASGVLPALPRVSGPGGAVMVSGPSPAGPVVLQGGTAVTFTWTYSGSLAGFAGFSTTVTGAEQNTGAPLTTGPVASSTVLIQSPAVLSGSPAVALPDPVCVGQPVTITLTVTNTGDAVASNLTGSTSLVMSGTGAAVLVSSPAVLPSLAGGAATTLVWTYSATSPGTLSWTATATATDSNSGAALTTGPHASNPVTLQAVGALAGSLSVSVPAMLGQWISISLTVTNTGGIGVTGIAPSPLFAVSPPLLEYIAGPLPGGPVTLAPGSATTFVWTYSVSGAGSWALTATATGITQGTGCPVSLTVSLTDLSGSPFYGCGYAYGIISTAAGTGAGGYNGDGIAATTAQLNGPWGVGVDTAGNVYIADYTNNRVRKVSAATGLISTIAGTGTAGYNGDGIAATAARLNGPFTVAVDSANNVYIADVTNNRIRKITAATGLISTIAGTGTAGYNGDGIAATTAQLLSPYAVSVDGSGNVYIGDTFNQRVRKVDAGTGLISTIAGTGTFGYNGDGIPATTARLYYPVGVTVDAARNIFIGDQSNARVRRIDAGTGLISTIAGTGTAGYNGDGIAATAAQLNLPTGVAVDAGGHVYIADYSNQRVRRVDAATGSISTVAGTGTAGYNGDGIAASTARLNFPTGVAVDGAFRLFIAELSGQRVRRVDPSGGLAAALAVLPAAVVAGGTATVTLTVTNLGCSTVAPVAPALALTTGGTLAGIATGPTPASVPTLSSGSAATFTWTLNTSAVGTVMLTATGTGFDNGISSTVWGAASGQLVILPPAGAGSCTPAFQWSRTHNGASNGTDLAMGMAFDPAGNLVVGGYESTAAQGTNWLVKKYNSAGSLLWSRTYNVAGINLDEQAHGVGTDAAGNIYAVGYEWYPANDNRYRIMKYDSAGSLVWSVTFHGALVPSEQIANAIAVDPAGTFAIAGDDQYAGPSIGWTTQKYTAAGVLLWSRTARHTSAKYDRPYGVALDPVSGAVVAVGNVEDSVQSYNWMVRKYDATGNLLWSDMFNGTANGGDGAYAVVVDLSGSVYVAGTTTTAGQSGNWMIRKYSSGGAIQWTINYNGAASGNDSAFGIGLDGAGNLLVTGDETVAGQGLNWLVRRYAPDGTLLNSYAYNSPANVDDSPRSMAVTSSGAFAVGGYETRTDLGQGLNWLVRMYSGGAGLAAELAVSPGSVDLGTPATVILTVTNNGCSAISSLTPALAMGPGGSLVSVTSGPTPGGLSLLSPGSATSFTWTLATLATGTVTLTATCTGTDVASASSASASATGLLTITTPAPITSCSPALVWSRSYNSPANGNDLGGDIAVDPSNNLVIAGTAARTDLGQGNNWWISKYDPAGTLLWNQGFNGASNSTDEINAIAVDPSGSVYAAGYELVGGQSYNWRIQKYSPGGAFIWAVTYNSPANNDEHLGGAAVDRADSSVIAVGWETRSDLGQGQNALIRKYDSGGTLIWSRSYNSPANGNDYATSVAIDPSGNVVVAANEMRSDLGEGNNIRILKYDGAGTLQWSVTYNDPANALDEAAAIATDAAGNILVAGHEDRTGVGQGFNVLVRKYSPAGALLWSRSYNSPANADEYCYGLAVDAAGNAVASGLEVRGDLGQAGNAFIRRYSSGGTFLDHTAYNSPANADDFARKVAVDNTGRLVTVGMENRPDLGQANNIFVQVYGPGTGLTASLTAVPPAVPMGTPAIILLTVSNNGCQAVTDLTAALAIGPGGSLANIASGPSPASVASLAPGFTTTFTWTLNTLAAGTVTLTATGTGIDSLTSSTVWAAGTGTLTVLPPAGVVSCTPTFQWSRTHNGVSNGADQVWAVAIDGAGNVVAGGSETNTGESLNWLVKKYDPTGVLIWSRTYNVAGVNSDEEVRGAGFDAAGNLYLAGYEWNSLVDNQVRMMKYDPAGSLIWSRSYNGPLGENICRALAVDPTGTFAIGATDQYAGPSMGWETQKYSSAGTLLWTRTARYVSAKYDKPYGVALDPVSGAVVAVGDVEDSAQSYNWMVRKYDSAGNFLWSDMFNGTANGGDGAYAVVVDVSGSIYVAGTTATVGQGANWMIRKYGSGGAIQWTINYNGAAGGNDSAFGIGLDGAGNLLVAGDESVAGQGLNWLVRRYAPNGTFLNSYPYNSPGNLDDSPRGLAVTPSGAFAAGGLETRSDLTQATNWQVRMYAGGAGLAASLAVIPGSILAGTPATIALTVTNFGCTTIAPLTPALAMGPGGSLASVATGPTPANIASLASGYATTFIWTLNTLGSGTVYLTATGTGIDTGTSSTVWAAATGTLLITVPPKRILCYGPTAGGLVATTPNVTITVWDEATWSIKTTAQFAAFDAIAFGDQPACFGSSTIWDTAVATRDTWSPAITGNAIILGNDPDAFGKAQLVHQAVLFAATGTGTGLYVALSCFYDGTPTAVDVELLAGLGNFTARQTASVCVDSVHKVAQHVALAGIDDAYLSNWGCSAHAGFETWPPTFMPVAIALAGSVFAACDGTQGLPVILASGVVPSCPALVLHKDVSPGSLVCGGSLLTYRISWSNAGGATVFGLTITDTLPNGTTYAAPSLAFFAGSDWLGMPALTASVYAADAAGPWTPGEPPDGAGPPQLVRWVVSRVSPGASGSLSFAVRVSATLLEGAAIANRASATMAADSRVYPSDEEPTVYRGGVILTKTPSGWAIPAGGPLTYTLAYGNSCSDTASNISLWDTLPAGAVFVAASAGGIYDGTKVVWNLPPLAGGGAAAVTVTVSVTGDLGSVGPNVGALDYAYSATIWQPTVTSNPVTVTVIAGVPVVHKNVSTAGPVCAGTVVTYAVSWSNAGAGTIWNLTFLDTLPAGAAYVAPSLSVTVTADALGSPALTASAWAPTAAGPWTAGEPPDATPGPLVLRWTVDRVTPDLSGQLGFSVILSSTIPAGSVVLNRATATMAYSATTFDTGTVSTTVYPSGGLEASAASATVVSTGQWITVTLTLTNTGGSDLTGLMPALAVGPGATLVDAVAGPLPAGPLTLAAGSATTFTWTYSASGSGLAVFTPSATASTCGGAADLAAGIPVSTTIQERAVLEAGLWIDPSPACPGDPVTITLTVTNTGEAAARGVDAGVVLLTGSGGVSALAGPTPPFPAELAGGSALTFTWTATALTAGTVTGSLTVTGDDANSGLPVTAPAASVPLTIQPTGSLAAAVAVPSPLSTGQWFTVTLTVTNTGAATVAGIVPDLAVAPGGGLVALEAGPVPTGPLSLASGATATFAWTYSVSGNGPVGFTATATGADLCAPRQGAGTAAGTLQNRAALAVGAAAFPSPRFIGQTFLLVVTITNTGEATAVAPAFAPIVVAGTGAASVDAGPWPPVPGNIPGGSTLSFTWTCTALADGVVDLTTTVTATDINSGAALGVAPVVSNTVLIQTPVDALIVRKFLSPTAPFVGGPVTYQLVVSNVGSSTVTGVTVSDTVAALVTGIVTTEPAGVGLPVLTDIPGTGTRYDWSAGALLLYPGTSWTFTVSGLAAAVCAPTPVDNSVMVRADFPVGGATDFVGVSPGFVLAPPPIAVSVTMRQTPAAAGGTGATVTYALDVMNTGSATITELSVTDTVSPVLTGVSPEQPAPFAAPLATSVAGGTRYVWTGTGLAFPPGGVWTFTLTGVAGTVPSFSTVGNTGFVDAGTACGAATASAASNGTWFTIGPPPVIGLVTVKTQTPVIPAAAAPMFYRIDITNTGGTTLVAVTVVDTVSPVVTGIATAQPAGFPAPLVSQVAGGTQYLWTGTGLTLFPGVTLSITLTGQLGPVCATTPVTNAAWIAGDDSVSTTVLITNTTGFAAQPAVLAVSASMTLSPPSPIPGGPVSYRLVVSNTGAATITDLEVVDTISAVLAAPGTDQPPGFGVPTVVQAAPSGTRFIWTGSGLALAPGAAFTFTISGVAGTVAAFTTVSNTACVTARSACAVTGAATNGAWFGIGPVPTLAITAIKTQTPLAPLPGAAVTYRLDLTNIGGTTILNVRVVDTVSPVLRSVTTAQPAGFTAPLVTQVPGGTQYEWTGAGLALYPGATLSITLTGLAGAVCAATPVTNTAWISASDSGSSTATITNATGFVAQPPVLAVTVATLLTPAAPVAGGPVTYRIVVTNSGQATITDLTLVDTVATEVVGATTAQPGGFPTPITTSMAGTGTRFVWSRTGLTFAPGATWTFTITGTAAAVPAAVTVSNQAIVSTGSVCAAVAATTTAPSFLLVPPGSAFLTATLTLTPSTRVMGGTFTAVLSVANIGASDATGVAPSLAETSAGTLLRVLSGPSPAGPLTIAAGGTQAFTWTCQADLPGLATLVGSVSGTDTGLGGPVAASATAVETITRPPEPIAPGVVKVIVGPRGVVRPHRGETLVVLVRCPRSGRISLVIVTMNGVRVIDLGRYTPGGGTERFVWDGRDASGNLVAPGGYVILVDGPGVRHTSKFAVVR